MRIMSNIPGDNVWRNKKINKNELQKSIKKLSSGLSINEAADNAAGLGISEKMNAQIREMGVCQTNVKKGIDLANTADGALNEVNELIRRTRDLCVQAANGTYQEFDKEMINKEIDHIMDEIDRVASSTHYNGIKLFEGNNSDMDKKITDIKKEVGSITSDDIPKLDINDTIWSETVKPSDKIVEFGKWERVSNKPLDLSTPAESATTTLMFDSGVDVNDPSTLNGKSFTVLDKKYYIHDSATGNVPTDISKDPSFSIAYFDSTTDTAAEAIAKVGERISYYNNKDNKNYYATAELVIDDVTGAAGMKINAPTVMFEETLNNMSGFPGNQVTRPVANGDGTYANGKFASSVDGAGPLSPPFKANINDDQAVNTLMTGKISGISPVNTPLTATQLDSLAANTFQLSGGSGGSTKTISFANSKTAPAGGIALLKADGTAKTREDIWNDIAGIAANMSPSITITADASGNVSASGNATETDGDMFFSMREIPKAVYTYTDYPGTALGVNTNIVKQGTDEFYAETLLEFPTNLSGITTPTSFQFDGKNGYTQTVTLYNSDSITGTLQETGSSYDSLYIDVKGKTQDEIMGSVFDFVKNRMNSTAVGTREGNNIRFKAMAPGPSDVKAVGKAVAHESKEILSSSSSIPVLTSSTLNTSRKFEFPIEIPTKSDGNTIDIDLLDKKGFAIGSRRFEFGKGESTNSTAKFIKLTQGMTLADLKADIGTLDGGITIDINSPPNGKIILTDTVYDWSDGYYARRDSKITNGLVAQDGLFSNDATVVQGVFSGGTQTNKPSTVIDFSGIDAVNKETLLGKGFRITCASCPSEYINIFFRRNNSEDPIPPSFGIVDDNGTPRVIKNLVVDLDFVGSGEDIVHNIVRDLTTQLDHFTEVQVGEPADQLLISDKRRGDYYSPAGDLMRAEVMTGVKTNFTYSIEEKEVPPEEEPPVDDDDGSTDDDKDKIKLDYNTLMIYAGSKPSHEYIGIDLPVFNAELLKLRNGFKEPNEGIAKADAAINAVSTARGSIGASVNRLEKTFNVLANGEEQLTSARSKIADLDMAKEMLAFTKHQILDQTSNNFIAQAKELPKGIIQLLQ